MTGYAVAVFCALGWLWATYRLLSYRKRIFEEMQAINARWHAIAVVSTLGAARDAAVQGRAWTLDDENALREKRAELQKLGIDLAALGLDVAQADCRAVSDTVH